MITVEKLWKSYGDKEVLQDVSFNVSDGSIFGLIGINGSGKSTLLGLLSGVLKADKGAVLLDGEEVFENEKAKKKLFYLPDDPFYSANASGKWLKDFYKVFYPFNESIFKRYTDLFDLNPNKPLRNFSKGMRRQMFIALALACKPKILLLDEAFDGLDPLARLEFKRGLIELQEEGATVVISSHSLRELEDISDSFALLDGRKIKSFGKIDEALSQICKLQVVFAEEKEEKDMPFPCKQFVKTGRVIHLVAEGTADELNEKLAPLQPLIVDEIPMDFEDMFLSEVEKRGYLK